MSEQPVDDPCPSCGHEGWMHSIDHFGTGGWITLTCTECNTDCDLPQAKLAVEG